MDGGDRRSILHRLLMDGKVKLPKSISDGLLDLRTAAERLGLAAGTLIGVDPGAGPSRTLVQIVDGRGRVGGRVVETFIADDLEDVSVPDEALAGLERERIIYGTAKVVLPAQGEE